MEKKIAELQSEIIEIKKGKGKTVADLMSELGERFNKQ